MRACLLKRLNQPPRWRAGGASGAAPLCAAAPSSSDAPSQLQSPATSSSASNSTWRAAFSGLGARFQRCLVGVDDQAFLLCIKNLMLFNDMYKNFNFGPLLLHFEFWLILFNMLMLLALTFLFAYKSRQRCKLARLRDWELYTKFCSDEALFSKLIEHHAVTTQTATWRKSQPTRAGKVPKSTTASQTATTGRKSQPARAGELNQTCSTISKRLLLGESVSRHEPAMYPNPSYENCTGPDRRSDRKKPEPECGLFSALDRTGHRTRKNQVNREVLMKTGELDGLIRTVRFSSPSKNTPCLIYFRTNSAGVDTAVWLISRFRFCSSVYSPPRFALVPPPPSRRPNQSRLRRRPATLADRAAPSPHCPNQSRPAARLRHRPAACATSASRWRPMPTETLICCCSFSVLELQSCCCSSIWLDLVGGVAIWLKI